MAKKSLMIQRVELSNDGEPIYCPFCGNKAVESDENLEAEFERCPHVLFVAHDMGFEYRSERFDTLMNIVGVEDDDIQSGNAGLDGFTDSITIEGAVKFARYQGPPSMYGNYVGFAHTEDD